MYFVVVQRHCPESQIHFFSLSKKDSHDSAHDHSTKWSSNFMRFSLSTHAAGAVDCRQDFLA